MSKENKQIATWRYDLTAASLLGVMAGFFALVSASGSGILNTVIFGIKLSPYLVFITFPVLCFLGIIVGRVFGKYISILYKFVKFGEAGGLNWLVDLGVINLLMLITGLSENPWASVFKAVSFSFAVANSYFWNKLWVFYGHKKQKESQELGKFITASLLGLGFNLIVFTVIKVGGPLLVDGFSNVQWANIATIVGSLSAMIFNFVLYKIWVFKD